MTKYLVKKTKMAILYSKKVSGFKISSQKMLRKIWELKEESCFKYYEVSRRDKSLMRLLFMMSLVFFLTNIPMAVGRIIQSIVLGNRIILCNISGSGI